MYRLSLTLILCLFTACVGTESGNPVFDWHEDRGKRFDDYSILFTETVQPPQVEILVQAPAGAISPAKGTLVLLSESGTRITEPVNDDGSIYGQIKLADEKLYASGRIQGHPTHFLPFDINRTAQSCLKSPAVRTPRNGQFYIQLENQCAETLRDIDVVIAGEKSLHQSASLPPEVEIQIEFSADDISEERLLVIQATQADGNTIKSFTTVTPQL